MCTIWSALHRNCYLILVTKRQDLYNRKNNVFEPFKLQKKGLNKNDSFDGTQGTDSTYCK